MTQLTQLTKDVFAVEVPEDSKDIKIQTGQPEILDYEYPRESRERDTQWCNAMIDLPPGTWRFICTTREATEEQAKEIVGWLQIGEQMWYQDYRFEDPRFLYELATQSMGSLCKVKGLDVNKNYALLKKEAPNG